VSLLVDDESGSWILRIHLKRDPDFSESKSRDRRVVVNDQECVIWTLNLWNYS